MKATYKSGIQSNSSGAISVIPNTGAENKGNLVTVVAKLNNARDMISSSDGQIVTVNNQPNVTLKSIDFVSQNNLIIDNSATTVDRFGFKLKGNNGLVFMPVINVEP